MYRNCNDYASQYLKINFVASHDHESKDNQIACSILKIWQGRIDIQFLFISMSGTFDIQIERPATVQQAMGSTVARRTRNVCSFERLVSVPDSHLSRNSIYQDYDHLTSANNVKTSSVSRQADEKKRNSSKIGEYFLDIQKTCNFSC